MEINIYTLKFCWLIFISFDAIKLGWTKRTELLRSHLFGIEAVVTDTRQRLLLFTIQTVKYPVRVYKRGARHSDVSPQKPCSLMLIKMSTVSPISKITYNTRKHVPPDYVSVSITLYITV